MATVVVGTISTPHYIAWVQRSLNRLLGAGLVTDGADTPAYRAWVKEWQLAQVLPQTGNVDEPTHQSLIRASAYDFDYLLWVQQLLTSLGHRGLAMDGRWSPQLVAAIKEFQGDHASRFGSAIGVDGVVGPKTELALIKSTGLMPPGQRWPAPKPKPKPRPKPAPARPHLSREQVTLLVWALIGERPTKATLAGEFTAFLKWLDLANLGSPTPLAVARHVLRLYWNALVAGFSGRDSEALGAIIGSAYAILDVAGGQQRSDLTPAGIPADWRGGFRPGYELMEARMLALRRSPVHKEALDILAAAPNKRAVITGTYLALRDVYLSRSGRHVYVDTAGNIVLTYPTARVARGALPGPSGSE